MPDIIEQLEAGKKIQEEQGIDIDSLRTKMESSEEEAEKKPKKRKKKETTEEKPIDPFEQAEQIVNENKSIEKPETKEEKPNKYPGFDFNDYYEVGQTIYFLRVIERLGIKEFYELKIRTIYPTMMVACEEKKGTHVIGVDRKGMVFTDKKTALAEYDNIKVEAFKDTNIKDELGNSEITDTEE